MKRYLLSKDVRFRVASSREVEASVRGVTHTMPMDLYRLTLELTEPRTLTALCEELDTDMSIDELGELLEPCVAAGIVVDPDAALTDPCLRDVLAPRLHDAAQREAIGSEIAAGRAVLIPDAFDPAFAERMYASLVSATKWRIYERHTDPFFNYHHHNLYNEDDFTPELRECSAILSSASTKRYVAHLTRHDCGGRVAVGASMYLPGDYSLPHSDSAHGRSVTYVWYLTKDWKPEWGGHFVWCPTGAIVSPTFNSLLLFGVTDTTLHFVSQVSPHAQGRRMSVNGWWHSSKGPTPIEAPAADWPVPMAPGNYGGGSRAIASSDGKSSLVVL